MALFCPIFLKFEMTYVIKKKGNNIWIGPEKFIEANEEGIVEDSLLFVFPEWTYHDLLGCIRFWHLRSSDFGGDLYTPDVIDYLETIKDLPSPPYEKPQPLYSLQDKVREFTSIVSKLISWGIWCGPEIDPGLIDIDRIKYLDDFVSELYRCYPKRLVDLYLDYISLARRDQDILQESRELKNITAVQEKWLEENKSRISDDMTQFLPANIQFLLRSGLGEKGKKKVPVPEYSDPSKITGQGVPEEVKQKLQNSLRPGRLYSLRELQELLDGIMIIYPGVSLGISDLWKYFDLEKGQDYSIKIISKK